MEEKNITKKLPTRDKIPLEEPEEINQIENNELIEEIIEDFEIRVKESESIINTKLQNIFIYD